MVQDKVGTLVYCKTNDKIVDVFIKSLSEVKFIKFCTFLRIQEVAIMGGCEKVITPSESLYYCVDRGMLEPKSLLVHHTSRAYRDNQSIGRFPNMLIVSSTEWSIGSSEFLVVPSQVDKMQFNEDQRIEDQ